MDIATPRATIKKTTLTIALSFLTANNISIAQSSTGSDITYQTRQLIELAQSGNPVKHLEAQLFNKAEQFTEDSTESLLGNLFNTVQVSVEAGDGKPEFELGALRAYDEKTPNSFFFSQLGLNTYDSRKTLNLGVGYRLLNDGETWMGGVNVFYDHEFPDDHQRSSLGLELLSSALKLRGNLYNAISDFKADRSGTDSSALDGHDLDLEVALPYLPGASLAYNVFTWEGANGASDLEGEKYSLGGRLSDNLSISASHTDYDDPNKKDIDRIQLSYQWIFGEENHAPTLFDVSSQAYQLSKLETEKYALVKRENRIAKQKQFSVTASGF